VQTDVRFFDFYGYDQKFQKMFSSKPPDEDNCTCRHAMDGGIDRPRDYRCGRRQPMMDAKRSTVK